MCSRRLASAILRSQCLICKTGVFKTLEEVVDFYNGGAGRDIKLETQTLPADKLHLTKAEKADLIAFMKTLTDTIGYAR